MDKRRVGKGKEEGEIFGFKGKNSDMKKRR